MYMFSAITDKFQELKVLGSVVELVIKLII